MIGKKLMLNKTQFTQKILNKSFSTQNTDQVAKEINRFKSVFHESQTQQMSERLTLVDFEDNIVGSISKVEGHLKKNLNLETAFPHRAFSLFVFNNKNELLLQQRSDIKVTFPKLWTNTCCSHNSHIESELQSEPKYIGMRRAAIRRAKFEMGINDLTEDELHVGSRILYYADACEQFAEYELDYIIFAKKDIQQPIFNPDEVMAVQYIGLSDFDDFIQERKSKYNEDITPWFRYLIDSKLKIWWQNLIKTGEFPKEAHIIEKFI